MKFLTSAFGSILGRIHFPIPYCSFQKKSRKVNIEMSFIAQEVFRNWLLKVRNDVGMTQKEVAEKFMDYAKYSKGGTDKLSSIIQKIKRWESGKMISMVDCVWLCRALNRSPNGIIGNSGAELPPEALIVESNEDILNRVARNLKKCRRTSGLSYEEIADKMGNLGDEGFESSCVWRYEQSKHSMSFSKVLYFCKVFNVNLEEFLFWSLE